MGLEGGAWGCRAALQREGLGKQGRFAADPGETQGKEPVCWVEGCPSKSMSTWNLRL